MVHDLVFRLLAVVVTLVLSATGTLFGQSAEDPSLDALRQHRRELARQPRRIIMNNDGCDVLYFPEKEKVTVKDFLARRTTPLAGTQVDAIAFCPTSSGFSFFTHDTKAGTLLTRSGPDFGLKPGTRNIAKELIDQGTDCFRAVVDFGHANRMQVFWSMRMNDTHDNAHRPDKPFLLFPPLKVEHPDWLVGNCVDRTPFGRWSSVDYARPEIRDLAFRYIEEACRNYKLDGVELDFFRHLCYFKSTAFGGTASDAERDMITDLMRRVRTMTEEVGLKRGRPILIAVRVPDSVGYSRDMGLDVERWLADGLVDMLITTGYFRLNPWEYSVALGHEYGVPVYPCLSDSRVRGETRFRRRSAASYRGRAMNAWLAGADGLYLFNFFDPKAAMWSEIGDPPSLATLNKLYFVNVRDGDPRRFLAKGREYNTLSLFGPSHPAMVTPGKPLALDVVIGDDLTVAEDRQCRPDVKLHLEAPTVKSAEEIRVKLNGTELTDGLVGEGWVDYQVPPDCVKQGMNKVEIAVEPSALGPDDWSAVYDAATAKKPGRPWNRDPGSERTGDEIIDGALLVADRGEVPGDYLYYRYPWGADPGSEAVVEARAKLKSGSSYIIVTNGTGGERLALWPDRIELFHHRKLQYKMDTITEFHRYRMELKGRDLKVYVDGQLRIDAPGAMGPRPYYDSRNEVAFGAANSGMTGEAYWATVKARGPGLVCRDLAVSVSYQTEESLPSEEGRERN